MEVGELSPADVISQSSNTTRPLWTTTRPKFRLRDPDHQAVVWNDAPRIHGAELEPWNVDGLHLRLVVPDDQPPGVYHAVVLDAIADCAAGTVTLRIPA